MPCLDGLFADVDMDMLLELADLPVGNVDSSASQGVNMPTYEVSHDVQPYNTLDEFNFTLPDLDDLEDIRFDFDSE